MRPLGHGLINTTFPDDVVRKLRRAYYASVSYTDSLIGEERDYLFILYVALMASFDSYFHASSQFEDKPSRCCIIMYSVLINRVVKCQYSTPHYNVKLDIT